MDRHPFGGSAALRRITAVFKWVVAEGYRLDNPARDVTGTLPKHNGHTKHHKALPHTEVGAALRKVLDAKGRRDPAALLCYRFIALTEVRSGEARGAIWVEFDLEGRAGARPSRAKSAQ